MKRFLSCFVAVCVTLLLTSNSRAQEQIPKDQARIATYKTDKAFETYLGSLRSGDAVQFSADGKTYSGIYIGKKTIGGVEQHVAINVVEIDTPGAGAPATGAASNGQGKGAPGPAGAGDNPGAAGIGSSVASAAAAAAAGQVVYRLLFVSPELEQRLANAQQQLNDANAQTQAAIASYRLVVDQAYVNAGTSLTELSEALNKTPLVVPSQLLNTFKDQPVRFSTTDPSLNGQMTRAFYQLANAAILSPIHSDARRAGVSALGAAEQAVSTGDLDSAWQFANTASAYASFLRTAADLMIGIDPISGLARDTYELFSGTDLISGQALGDVERALRAVSAGANLATLGAVPVVFGGVNVIRKIALRVRAEKYLKIFTIVDDLPFTKHGMEQFTARRLELVINSKTATRLTPEWIKRTVSEGQSFWDYKHKTVAFFSESEGGKWLHVAVAKNGQPRITTVIVRDDLFVLDALWNGKPRFVPYSSPLPELIIK